MARRTVNFDRFRAPGSIDTSALLEPASKKLRSIAIVKSTAGKQKIVRSPKTAMRRFLHANVLHQSVNFYSFSSTPIDRHIGIDGLDVEKATFDSFREINGAPAKNCSVPENRDASISLCKHTANVCKMSMVWAALGGKLATRLPNGAGWLGWAGWQVHRDIHIH